MNWSDVGDWLKGNAGSGAALVGSLLTGNVPGAIAAGVALVGSATGVATADAALDALKSNPETVLKLKELALQNDISIREHIRAMTEAELKDKQAEHEQTQQTIRNGDNATDKFVLWTRPGQSWVSLFAGFGYIFSRPDPSIEIALIFFAMPWAYAGLRQIGKGFDSMVASKSAGKI
jgi:hypothetical protein